jgi:hypothetical protein
MVPDFQFCKDFIREDRGSSLMIIACDIGVHCGDELWENIFEVVIKNNIVAVGPEK